MDALLHLEGSDRFSRISGLVNISRHTTIYSEIAFCRQVSDRDLWPSGFMSSFQLSVFQRFSFSKQLGNARFCCRLIASDRSAIDHSSPESETHMELTRTLSQSGALYFAHHTTTERRAALFRRFAAAARLQPPDMLRRTFADSHVSRRFHPDNGR
jgi:hypothetical protein